MSEQQIARLLHEHGVQWQDFVLAFSDIVFLMQELERKQKRRYS